MKIRKILYSTILGIGSFIGLSFADCYIYGSDNELLMMFECDEPGTTTEITLEGNRTQSISSEGNGAVYTFQDGFEGTTVYYTDSYGNNKELNVTSDLYINGDYSVSYTGQQYLQLNENSCKAFNGYKPVFDITGSTVTIDTGNVFNNWSDNALKVLLSNIPSYIQYITIFAILLFLFSFLRRFKRKR